MYDAPMASANTFNKANVCFGLVIPWRQSQGQNEGSNEHCSHVLRCR